MKIFLSDGWTVTGSWPFTVMQGNSVEVGVKLQGVTPEIEAHVPGSVYDDLLRAGLIADPYYERNSLECEWVANRFWGYRNKFVYKKESDSRVRLVLKGIDYHAHIWLNGQDLGEHKGMYTRFTKDVTELLCDGENTLTVLLENAPNEMGQIGYTSRTFTQKARFGYKWDFGTRLVNLGIYDDVYLDIATDYLDDVHIKYKKDGVLTVTAANKNVSAVLSYNGRTVCTAESTETEFGSETSMKIENPVLWYPNGEIGERITQPLYTLTLRTADDVGEYKVGLRTVEYRKAPGATEDTLPYTPVINGKPVYIKGMNMVPLCHMYGCVTEERYRALLTLARDAGVNLIRVWGGGLIEKEDFYNICDEYGIMVWQEFIQSSSGIDNIPSKIPEFLELCRKTAIEAVREKRNHTSLTYWSGGNELMDENGIPSTYDDPNIAMLKEITELLNPEILMLPTSASGPTEWFDENDPSRNRDIHGPWKYEGTEGQYSLYNRSTIQLHSEFGVDGMSNYDSIKTVLAPQNMKVTTMGENFTWRHHGEWWDTYVYREKPIFGELCDLEILVKLSQYMQAEGLRYAIEAHRRRSESAKCLYGGFDGKIYPSVGAIVWQLNEPWPNVSCTSLVDYYSKPKAAYYFFRDAEKPLHVSLRYSKLVYSPGEEFGATVWTHDDRKEGYDKVTLNLYRDGYTLGGDNSGCLVSADCGKNGRIGFSVCAKEAFYVECILKSGDYEDKNVYMFLVAGENGKAPTAPVLKFFDEYMK